ncbi:hypothetical protein P7C71_g336, partial [Lecanoromycetidae sp. Uapishka_2]
MTGLRLLVVAWEYYICTHHPLDADGWNGSLEQQYLEPLLKIRGLEKFDLEYTDCSSQEERDEVEGDIVDNSAEAVAYKDHLKEVVCTPRGQVLDEGEDEDGDEAEAESDLEEA